MDLAGWVPYIGNIMTPSHNVKVSGGKRSCCDGKSQVAHAAVCHDLHTGSSVIVWKQCTGVCNPMHVPSWVFVLILSFKVCRAGQKLQEKISIVA